MPTRKKKTSKKAKLPRKKKAAKRKVSKRKKKTGRVTRSSIARPPQG